MSQSSENSAQSTRDRPKKLLGHEEPRIFTPPLRKLTPKTSLGFACIEFAEDVCDVTLYPWQKWLLVHALELHPDGGFRFRTIVVLVARQNGKSMLSVILSLFFMYVLGRELVIGTAQDLDVAEEIWQEAVDVVEDVPELDDLKERVVKVNGKKALELKTGERYKVKAANRRAGRGLSGELILLDELREHQNFDAWGAITKTTIARPDAQVWALSNAGDATSVVLRHLRTKAHEALGDPDRLLSAANPLAVDAEEVDLDDLPDDGNDSLGIFEWSSPPQSDTKDRNGWAYANPSLGYGRVTERSLAAAEATDPEWVFRTECLCQWSDGTIEGPFPPGAWESGIDSESKRNSDSPIRFGLDVSTVGHRAWISIAAYREDGKAHVEIVATRTGTSWVADWFKERVAKYGEIVIAAQGRGAPVTALFDDLNDIEGVEILPWQGGELSSGTMAFYNAICEQDGSTITHIPQPALDVAASIAVTKPSGDAYLWDRNKSPGDISPLFAVNAAWWALRKFEDPEEETSSTYEDTDLMVV